MPYAIRGAIERDLERLESVGVIEKTNYSNWAAPIVAGPKPDGTVRICGDYKVGDKYNRLPFGDKYNRLPWKEMVLPCGERLGHQIELEIHQASQESHSGCGLTFAGICDYKHT